MTDLFDRAAELELRQREAALAAARTHATGPSLSHCQDCGEAIPDKRRQAVSGCRRCIDCQQEHELRRMGA